MSRDGALLELRAIERSKVKQKSKKEEKREKKESSE